MSGHVTALGDDTVAIFLLHGVLGAPREGLRNYTRKHLPKAEFTAIVDSLASAGTAVTMDEIVDATRGRRPLPPRAFALTFDDGFANNYSVARPILAERGLPATIYVTTGFIDANASSWIDQIEYAVEAAPPVRLRLPALDLDVPPAGTAEARRRLLDEIRVRVKANAAVDPYAIAAEVWAQFGVTDMDPDPELDRKMTWDQVREVADDPLWTIGGHGKTHRILEFLSDDALEDEVSASLAALRARLARPVTHYSYPEGLAHCYSDRVIRVLQRHGIVCAPSAEPGVNRVGDDLFRLRRIMVS